VAEEGAGLDVSSGGELAIALAGGLDPARIVLHGNVKPVDELGDAATVGIGRIVVDSSMEIAYLSCVARRPQRVLIRVTPGIDIGGHPAVATGVDDQKFGFALADGRVNSCAARRPRTYWRAIADGQAASSPFTTSTPVCSTPTVTGSAGANPRACELDIWALITEPSCRVQYTREIGPRNATELTVDAPAGSDETVTDSGRTIANPWPAEMEPANAGTDVPSSCARPPDTSAGTLLLRPTKSATNGVAGLA